MSRHITFEIPDDQALDFLEDIIDTHPAVRLISLARSFDDELSDDEVADDIGELLPRPDLPLDHPYDPAKIVASLREELDGLPSGQQLVLWREAQSNFTGHNDVMRAIDAVIDELTEADPTPAHGIARPSHPRIIDPLGAFPDDKGYWIDKAKAMTQGSGDRVQGLESVPCPTCGAPTSFPCAASSHAAYRRGYGHTARRLAHASVFGDQS